MREHVPAYPLTKMLGTLSVAVLAYSTAAIANVILTAVAGHAIRALPRALQVADLQTALFAILLLVTLVALGIPLFQSSREPAVRRFSLFSTGFLIAYVVLHAVGPVDPDVPLNLFIRYVVAPLQQTAGHA